VNSAAVAAAVAEIDSHVLTAISRIEELKESGEIAGVVAEALQHCQDTLALLSDGLEHLVLITLQNGTPNPSFN
jgi:hypothetical protein